MQQHSFGPTACVSGRDLLWCKSMAAKYTVDEMRKGCLVPLQSWCAQPCGGRYYYPRDLADFDRDEKVVEGRRLRDAWRATCENSATAKELARDGFEPTGDELVSVVQTDTNL